MSVKSKNIHVLPTDKPSKLFYNVGGALLFTNYENHNGVNIYITSDEEIKEGDWFYNTIYLNPEVFKACENGHGYVNCSKYSHNRRDCKKIILTTDQDLIKDGVQAIDDEFLEWFVKNPSCEEVETLKVWWSDNTYSYDIILPKEEPKQETLEEVIGRQFQFNSSAVIKDGKPVYLIDKHSFKIAVDNILKWQAERMYSEKEVYDIIWLSYLKENR